MPLDGFGFLKVAQDLADTARNLKAQNAPDWEAYFRCSVSRAYYAVFHHARKRAMEWSSFKPTWSGEDHAKVVEALKRTRFGVHVASLRDLRVWRNTCDYDEKPPDDPLSLMETALKQAEFILKI